MRYIKTDWLLFGSILLFYYQTSIAQPKDNIHRFHRYYSLGEHSSGAMGGIVTSDSSYLIAAAQLDSNGWIGYAFFKTDKQGTLTKKRLFSTDSVHVTTSSAIKLFNGKMAMLALRARFVNRDTTIRYPMVVITDENIDSTAEYHYPDSLTGIKAFINTRIYQMKDSSIIILGYNNKQPFKSGVCMQLDKDMKVKRIKEYITPSRYEMLTGLIQHYNGLYYLIGLTGNGQVELGANIFVRCLDSAWSMKWRYVYSLASIGGECFVLPSGEMALLSDSLIDFNLINYWKTKAAMYVIDQGGNLKFSNTYDYASYLAYFEMGHLHPSTGEMVVMGRNVDTIGGASYVTLSKFTSDHRIIWRHRYGRITGSKLHMAYAFEPTPDGGFLIIGDGEGMRHQDALLIKTDSNGFDPFWNTLEFTRNINDLSAKAHKGLSA
ncbi:MAG: hypothetical protein KDC37_01150, partial [Flavobacteriales bacterium]|nr:hypothetical protein [Flavobacteriales bacterium]